MEGRERLEGGIDRALSTLNDLSGLLQDAFDFPETCGLVVRLSDADEINARVFREAPTGAFVIEFTRGLMMWLDAAATVVLKSPEVPSASSQPPPVMPGTGGWTLNPTAQAGLVPAALPKDYAQLREELFQTFLLGIFAHEAAHLVRGHLSLAGRLGVQGGFDEFALRRRTGGADPATIRLLEFDADAYAARLLARLILDPPACLRAWRARTPQDTVVECILGMTLFFVALEGADQKDRARSRAYPEPLLRMVIMLVQIDEIWQEHHPGEDIFEAGFEAALKIVAQLEPVYPQADVLRQLLEPGFVERLLADAEPILGEIGAFEQVILAHALEIIGPFPPSAA